MNISLAQWAAHPTYRQELADALAQPALKFALDIVRDLGATPSVMPSSEINLIDFFAIEGARKQGHVEALANLKMLASVSPPKKPDQKPWSHFEKPVHPTA